MKLLRWSLWLSLTAGAISFVTLSFAAEPTAQSPEPQPKVIPQVDFKGGKVRDLIDFLREQTGENIVAGPGVDDIPLPELKLRNVTLLEAVNAIDVATGGIVVGGATYVAGRPVGDVIALSVDPRRKPADAGADVVFHAFLLPVIPEEIYAKQMDDLVSAIHGSIEFYNKARPEKTALSVPKMEVHKDAHMFLLAGPRESMKIAAQVYAVWSGQSNPLDFGGEKPSAVKVTILGAVQKPGVYSVDDASLAQLIGLAGGLTNQGDSKKVGVLSKNGSKTSVDFKSAPASYELREGDVVTVPERFY